jgi:hypothetical protein
MTRQELFNHFKYRMLLTYNPMSSPADNWYINGISNVTIVVTSFLRKNSVTETHTVVSITDLKGEQMIYTPEAAIVKIQDIIQEYYF